MTRKTRNKGIVMVGCSVLLGLVLTFLSLPDSRGSANRVLTTEVTQECDKCEGKCKPWIDKCKEGGQYACYKAAACLCKCNLDAGGCGSSKEALQECYEKNEKLAKDLEPGEGE